jgi:hypothetical protein
MSDFFPRLAFRGTLYPVISEIHYHPDIQKTGVLVEKYNDGSVPEGMFSFSGLTFRNQTENEIEIIIDRLGTYSDKELLPDQLFVFNLIPYEYRHIKFTSLDFDVGSFMIAASVTKLWVTAKEAA